MMKIQSPSSVIVTDAGFQYEDTDQPFKAIEDGNNDVLALDVSVDTNPDDILLSPTLQIIRINFPIFSDGRGFTIARQIRLKGFKGRLRAKGPLIADQYRMARRAGFDEIEIPHDIAIRQPEREWKLRKSERLIDYQSRLRR